MTRHVEMRRVERADLELPVLFDGHGPRDYREESVKYKQNGALRVERMGAAHT